METIKDCFEAILNGDKEASRQSAGKVRKNLFGRSKSKNEYRYIKNTIENAPEQYEKITEDWRREYFVRAISIIYFLHDRREQPDFLFPWLMQLLQHNNGMIRFCAVKMINQELGPLTVHVRFPDDPLFKTRDLDPGLADEILYTLFVNLVNLTIAYNKDEHRRYKYVNSLPASKYKSAQMVLTYMEELYGLSNIERMAHRAGFESIKLT